MCPNADHTFRLCSPAKVMTPFLQQRGLAPGPVQSQGQLYKARSFHQALGALEKTCGMVSLSVAPTKSTKPGVWWTGPWRTQSSSCSLSSPAVNTGVKRCFRTSTKPRWIPVQGSVGKRKVSGGLSQLRLWGSLKYPTPPRPTGSCRRNTSSSCQRRWSFFCLFVKKKKSLVIFFSCRPAMET